MGKVAVGVAAFLLGVILFVVVGLVLLLSSLDECEDPGVSGLDDAGPVVSTEGFALPEKNALNHVTSEFGPRWGTMHQGIDIAQGFGTPIYAFADGVVVDAGPAEGFGQWIVIEHNFDGQRYLTVYGHMYADGLHVKTGDRVSAGQHIADEGSNGGSTGSHLHFEIWENSRDGDNARNPRPWLEKVAAGDAPAKVEVNKKRRGSASGVFIIGDSITVGAQSALERKLPGVRIDAEVSRQYTKGVEILEETSEQFDVVVMALGTNGVFSQADVDATVEAAGGARVYLMTVAGDNVSSAKAVNDLVRANASSVGVVDWAAEVRRNPEYVGSDGVHPTAEGLVAFADVVSRSVKGGDSDSVDQQKLAADPQRFNENGLQRESVRLGRVILQKYPEIKTIGGYRDQDDRPDHPSGQAIDIMIPDWDTDEGKRLGQEIADFVLANAEDYAVEYVIWRQEYIPVEGTGYVMSDLGSPTYNHFDHVHVTVKGSGYPAEDEEYVVPADGDVSGSLFGSSDGSWGDCDTYEGGDGRDVGFSKDEIPPELHKWIRLGGRVCKEVPAPLLAALLKQESGFRQDAVNPDSGAQGYAQFMPDTWAQEGREVDENGEPIGPPGSGSPFVAKDAVMASARYLCGIARRQRPLIASGQIRGDSTKLMLAGYNAGEGAVLNAGGVPNYVETQQYVEIITQSAESLEEEL